LLNEAFRIVSLYTTAILTQIEVSVLGSRIMRYHATILLVVVHSLYCLYHIYTLSKNPLHRHVSQRFFRSRYQSASACIVHIIENCCFCAAFRPMKNIMNDVNHNTTQDIKLRSVKNNITQHIHIFKWKKRYLKEIYIKRYMCVYIAQVCLSLLSMFFFCS